jgi:NUMOD4 motif
VQDLPNEQWRPIKGYEDYYEVSNLGRVRSLDREIERCDGVIFQINSRPLIVTYMKSVYVPGEKSPKHFFTSPSEASYAVIFLSRDGKKKTVMLASVMLEAFGYLKPARGYFARKIYPELGFILDNLVWSR